MSLIEPYMYELISKKINLQQFVKVKVRTLNSPELFETMNSIIDQMINVQIKEYFSRPTKQIVEFFFLNLKNLLVSMENNVTSKKEINPLFIYVIYVAVEIYHYVQFDIYNTISRKDKGNYYKYNYWKQIKDVKDYFKNKIYYATSSLMKLKNIFVDYRITTVSIEPEDILTKKMIEATNKFSKSIFRKKD